MTPPVYSVVSSEKRTCFLHVSENNIKYYFSGISFWLVFIPAKRNRVWGRCIAFPAQKS